MKYLFLVNRAESANGICVKAVMRELAQDNEVHCITGAVGNGLSDYEEDGILYHPVKPRSVSRIKLALTVGTWPWTSPVYTEKMYRKIMEVCKTNDIGCIVAAYAQIDPLIAGRKAKKQLGDVKYIPYFLDSLSGGYGPKQFSKEWTEKRGLKWEQKLLPDADAVIFMKSSREHHEKYMEQFSYYNRAVFLDLPLFDENIRNGSDENCLMDREKVNLLYVGSLPPGIRSPEYILETFRHISDEDWNLYFIGTADNTMLNEAAERDERIHVLGRMDHAQALAYESEASALINIGNSNEHMLPSKVFEYFASGRPVISLNVLENDKCNRYLEKYPASLIINTEKTDHADAADMIKGFIKEHAGVSADMDSVRENFYDNTPEATAEFIRSVAERGM